MMDRYKPEKTSDPVMAILVACHAQFPTLAESDPVIARLCAEGDR